MKKILNLGYANGWSDDSKNYDIIKSISAKGGVFEHHIIGRCDHKYIYEDDEKVVIYYEDSSD